MPTTVAEVLDDLKDKEAVSKLTGLVTVVHADRLKPTQKQGQKGSYWSAFLPVTIRDDNRSVDVNITWPVSKDGHLEGSPADLIRGGMELKVLSGQVSAGKPKQDGGHWPNSVWTKLADIRLDGAATPPGVTSASPAVSPPAPGEIGPPAAPQAQTSAQARPSLPVRTQAQAVVFACQAWDMLHQGIASGESLPPTSEDLAHLVGILTQGYLQGRIE